MHDAKLGDIKWSAAHTSRVRRRAIIIAKAPCHLKRIIERRGQIGNNTNLQRTLSGHVVTSDSRVQPPQVHQQ